MKQYAIWWYCQTKQMWITNGPDYTDYKAAQKDAAVYVRQGMQAKVLLWV